MNKPKLESEKKNKESRINKNPSTMVNNQESESENESNELYMDLTIRKTIHSSKSSFFDLQEKQYCTRFIASSSKTNKQKFFFIILFSTFPFKPAPRTRIMIKHVKTKAKKKTVKHVEASHFLIDFKTKKDFKDSSAKHIKILIVDTISNSNDKIFITSHKANLT
jgi:hypothetical protein